MRKGSFAIILLVAAILSCTTIYSLGPAGEAEQAADTEAAGVVLTELANLRTATAEAAALTADAEAAISTANAEAAALTANAILPTATLTLSPIPEAVLQSGTYEVEVSTGGKQYHSTWTLEVLNGVITGNAGWDCCPGPRVDPLSGTLVGEEVTIVRDCSGQGWVGPCSQTYSGRVQGNIISGTITGTAIPASGATWTLYLRP